MAQNFIECDREQLLLTSPSLREWLPENHLAWFVIDAVKDIDLSPFYARYREDGWGRAVAVSRSPGPGWEKGMGAPAEADVTPSHAVLAPCWTHYSRTSL